MSDIERHTRTQRAIELLSKGFRSPIVVIETNLSSSTVREMAKIINDGKRASSGQLPSPNYFISSVAALSEASLFASIYCALAKESFKESIDIDRLIKSHEMYLEFRLLDEPSPKALDINKCWVIARDLRAGMAWLRQCENDSSYYLLVDEQKIPPCCPWCSNKKTSNKSSRSAVATKKDSQISCSGLFDKDHPTESMNVSYANP